MTEYACTLTPEDAARRARQDEPLRRGLRGHDRDGREARLRFGSDLLDHVHAFVREESACCSFFDFEVEASDDEVELRVRAPAGAQPMLDTLLEAFGAQRAR